MKPRVPLSETIIKSVQNSFGSLFVLSERRYQVWSGNDIRPFVFVDYFRNSS